MLAGILAVAKRETRRIFHQRTLYILIVILPIFLFSLLTGIYNNRVVTDIPIAVFDRDDSGFSRSLIRGLEATRTLKIDRRCGSVDEIKNLMLAGKVQGAVVIPEGMENDIKLGKSAVVTFFKNTNNLIIGNLILKEALQVTRTFSAGVLIKKLRSGGIGDERAQNLANPIHPDIQSIGNPGYNYMNYMAPGLMPFILQLSIMIAAVLIINGEFIQGTFGDLMEKSGRSPAAVVFGKLAAHLGLNCVSVMVVFGIIFMGFGVAIPGSITASLLWMVFFVAVVISIGMLISALFRSQAFASDVATFFTIPTFIFSGFTYPLWGMPEVHSGYANLLPFTHFFSAFIKVFYLGAPIKFLAREFVVLGVYMIISLAVIWILLRREIRKAVGDIDRKDRIDPEHEGAVL